MIEPGNYQAKCIEYTWGFTRNSKEELQAQFEITAGDRQGERLSKYFYFTDRAADITCKALMAMGWDGADLGHLGALDTEVIIVVEHEEWNGKTRAKVSWVNSRSDGTISHERPMTDQQVREFAAKMKGRLAGLTRSAQPSLRSVDTAGHDPF